MQEIKVDIAAIVEIWQVGAHFTALLNGVLVASSILCCLFLRPKRGLENNVPKTLPTQQFDIKHMLSLLANFENIS